MLSVFSLDSIFIMIIPLSNDFLLILAIFSLHSFAICSILLIKWEDILCSWQYFYSPSRLSTHNFRGAPQPTPFKSHQVPPSITLGSITVSRQGQVGIVNGVDIQCYNYTLATPFTCTPGVAIGSPLVMQLSMAWRVNTVRTYSSLSRQSTLTAMESSHSLWGLIGPILDGLDSSFHLLLKLPHRSRLDIIK